MSTPQIRSQSERLRSLAASLDSETWGTPLPDKIELDFYPYAGLKHTIRKKDGILLIRISDVLHDAPSQILKALLKLLAAKLHRTPPDSELEKEYRAYITRRDCRLKARRTRRDRGRKQVDPPAGKVYDLSALFERLNEEFFQNGLHVEIIGWSRKSSRTILGAYDAAFRSISLNRRLDNPLVPEHVVRYVLYHEMLHIHFGDAYCGNRRSVHHRRFREAEQAFPDYRRAVRFIEKEL